MLHCTMASSGAWQGVAGHLGAGLTMTGLDLRGHGKSEDWDGVTDYHSICTKDAEGFLTRPMHLIGHSLGATLALRLALERPEMVRSLTMIEPVFAAVVKGTDVYAEYMTKFQPFKDAVERGSYEAAAKAFSQEWGTGSDWATLPAQTRAHVTTRIGFIPAVEPAVSEDNAGMAAEGRLEAVGCPVLLIEGRNSPDIIAAINAALAARLPDVLRVTIDGASHMAPITHSAPVAKAIADFLKL